MKETLRAHRDHKGDVIFEVEALRLRAGDSKMCPDVGWLVVDLANQFKPAVALQGVTLPNVARVELDRRLEIQWPDGDIPTVAGKSFWTALALDLCELSRQDPEGLDVVVACLGGHGRTGTALAILGHFLQVIPLGIDPVIWIRRAHCERAVETEKQCRYVERMTGRTVTAKPSERLPAKTEEWRTDSPLTSGLRNSKPYQMGADWRLGGD